MGIKREAMLILVDTTNNNNKFYKVTLDDDGTTVTKSWGRVGNTGQSSVEQTGDYGFDRAVAAKEKKGYKQTSIISNNNSKANSAPQNESKLELVAKKHLAKSDDDVILKLIERLVKVNQHQIMAASGGKMTVDDDGTIKTPLGLVDLSAISKAESILTDIRKATVERKKISLLDDYLTLIPQNIGTKRGWHEDYLKDSNLLGQFDFLKQLKDSLDWAKKTAAVNDTKPDEDDEDFSDFFRMQLDKVSSTSKEFKQVERQFRDTRNQMHTSRNLKLVNVFAVEDRKAQEAYAKSLQEFGNSKSLWHGTKASNVLSILTKGMFVPPARGGTISVTGRMFGDGVYFSDQSTKALNYANGYWGGTSRSDSNCFMFLSDVVMGNEYRPRQRTEQELQNAHYGTDSKGKRYNSINVKGGTCGVMNNEMIIWDTNNISIKYLAEFAA